MDKIEITSTTTHSREKKQRINCNGKKGLHYTIHCGKRFKI